MGGRRDRYRALGGGASVDGYGHNGHKFTFRMALPVDPSGRLVDGRSFADIRDYKRLLLADERQIARNLTKQLVTYATGAPVRFADRETVESILEAAKPGSYGVNTLIHGIVLSDLFLRK